MESNATSFKVRHRVNFSQSVKGVVTPEVTCEMYDSTKEQCVEEATNMLMMAQKVAKDMSKEEK